MIKTKNGKLLDIQKLSWYSIRDRLVKVNPELADIINRFEVDDSLSLYLARYRFGSPIINNSIAYLPMADDKSIPFNDPSLPESIYQDLYYDPSISNPLGVIMSKNCESFINIGSRYIPNMLLAPGDIFGCPRIMNLVMRSRTKSLSQIPISAEIVAGTKSSLMLPKISDRLGVKRLNKYLQLKLDTPSGYYEHNQIFTQIALNCNADWRAEILYFSNQWIEKLKNPGWAELYGYLAEIRQLYNKLWHNTPRWTAVFSEIESVNNLSQYSGYVLASVKYLFAIAAGSAPGFEPATNEDSIPLNIIQNAYIKGYGLEDYYPCLMIPSQFTTNDTNALYYSLNHPTLPQYNPETYKGKSLITLENQIQEVLRKYQKEIINSETAQLNAPSLYEAVTQNQFTFYHDDPGCYPNILSSERIYHDDKRFQCQMQGNFPSHSPFLRGCIKISKRNRNYH